MVPAYRYRARCHRVIDADTLDLDVDLGFHVRRRVTIRLRGVNAPELNTAAGQAARDWTVRLLTPTPYAEENPELVVESYRGHRSFARWVGHVNVNGDDLGALLVAAGHAVAA